MPVLSIHTQYRCVDVPQCLCAQRMHSLCRTHSFEHNTRTSRNNRSKKKSAIRDFAVVVRSPAMWTPCNYFSDIPWLTIERLPRDDEVLDITHRAHTPSLFLPCAWLLVAQSKTRAYIFIKFASCAQFRFESNALPSSAVALGCTTRYLCPTCCQRRTNSVHRQTPHLR